MKHNKKGFILPVVFFGIVILLIGSGLYLYFLHQKKSDAPVSQTTQPVASMPTPTPTPTPTSQTIATSTVSSTSDGGYNLFAPIPNDGDEIPTKYMDDGIISGGTYNGYHRVVALRLFGEAESDIDYSVFITKDYKTFYYDADLDTSYSPTDLATFNQAKVTKEVSNVELNHPAAIPVGNFVLVRQGYYPAVAFNDLAIENNATELPSTIAGLHLYADTPQAEVQRTGPEANSTNQNYISGVTQVKIKDENGVIFNYELVSKENYARELKLENSTNPNDAYAENAYYLNTDFAPGISSYSSYDVPFPGVCGDVSSRGYILKNVSINDLTPFGTTLSGTQLYIFTNSNHPLNQEEYTAKITSVYEANYDGARAGAEQMNHASEPTYAQYLAKNPIIIVKDPWNRFIAFGEFQYLEPGGCGKPVVYLYPTTPTEVKVMLDKPTRFTVDIPIYKNGWDVLAHPDSSLTDLQPQNTDCAAINSKAFGSEYAANACKEGIYPYLYWSGHVDNLYPQANKGWVVAQNNLSSFLNEKLTTIGLTEKEKSDMMSYWIPELTAKNSPYYRISLFQTADMNMFAPMTITPKPDTLIRVFLDWFSLTDANLNIQPQNLLHINRIGFTAVEWGGLKQ